uniref:Uncharacterized protein n=1 Tax=Timema shepardi TaxID=629360 RepID=A0A7R9AQP6_TIMSH|nr:unnamed protein product [Timema shepardi]
MRRSRFDSAGQKAFNTPLTSAAPCAAPSRTASNPSISLPHPPHQTFSSLIRQLLKKALLRFRQVLLPTRSGHAWQSAVQMVV